MAHSFTTASGGSTSEIGSLPLAGGIGIPTEPPRDFLGNETAQASCLSFKALRTLLDFLHLGIRQPSSSLPLAGGSARWGAIVLTRSQASEGILSW
jgi:hypothetical protein